MQIHRLIPFLSAIGIGRTMSSPLPPHSRPQQPSILSRAISGSLGSALYLTTFNPLEVVKVSLVADVLWVAESAILRCSCGILAIATPLHCLTLSFLLRPDQVRQQASSLASSSTNVKAFHRGRNVIFMKNGLALPKAAFPCLLGPGGGASVNQSPLAKISARFLETASMQSRGIVGTIRSIFRAEGVSGEFTPSFTR